jgi:hypothetical protein
VCVIICKTTLELEHTIFTTLYLTGAKNTDSWRAGKGDLQRAFPLDVPMVPSSVLTVTTDGECLTYGGFSLDEIIHLGSFEFITNYFGGLGLSPRRSNSGATFMGSTHSGSPSLRRAIIEDSTKEFHMVSSGEGPPTSPLPEGEAQGLCLLLLQQHHGWRML